MSTKFSHSFGEPQGQKRVGQAHLFGRRSSLQRGSIGRKLSLTPDFAVLLARSPESECGTSIRAPQRPFCGVPTGASMTERLEWGVPPEAKNAFEETSDDVTTKTGITPRERAVTAVFGPGGPVLAI